MESLDNRELALVVWAGFLLMLGVATKSGRKSLGGIIKALLAPQLLSVLVWMAAYCAAAAWALSRVDLWNRALASETILWFLVSGIVLLYRTATAKPHETDFFKKTLRGAIAGAVVIEFIINLYPTHIVIELLLVPTFVLLGGVLGLSEAKPEYSRAKPAVEFLMSLIGLALLSHTVGNIIKNPEGFFNHQNGREFLLPVLMTVVFIPFIYVVGLQVAYGTAFRWINFDTNNRRARLRAKIALMLKLRGRTRYVRVVTMMWGKRLARAESLREALDIASQISNSEPK